MIDRDRLVAADDDWADDDAGTSYCRGLLLVLLLLLLLLDVVPHLLLDVAPPLLLLLLLLDVAPHLLLRGLKRLDDGGRATRADGLRGVPPLGDAASAAHPPLLILLLSPCHDYALLAVVPRKVQAPRGVRDRDLHEPLDGEVVAEHDARGDALGAVREREVARRSTERRSRVRTHNKVRDTQKLARPTRAPCFVVHPQKMTTR